MDGQACLSFVGFIPPLGVLPPLLLLVGVLLALLLIPPLLLLALMLRFNFGCELVKGNALAVAAGPDGVPDEDDARSNWPCIAAAAAREGDMGVSGDGGSNTLGHWDTPVYEPTASTAALAAAAAWACAAACAAAATMRSLLLP